MQQFTKSRAYAMLTEIREKHDISVSPYIHKVAENDTVPYEVLVFINKYEPLPQLEVYNHIYNNRKRNPLYKNLINENLCVEERAVALSSLLTQTLITTKFSVRNKKLEEVKEYADLMNLDMVTEALMQYVNGDDTLLNEVFMYIRDVLKQLYK